MSGTNRKKLRLQDFDYSTNGAFFLTICTKQKQKLLCEIKTPAVEGDAPILTLTPVGTIVAEATEKIPGIDKYVIMPNHVHMIVFQEDGKNIPTKIRLWKSVITAKCGRSIWQDSYYDHVIRNEMDYQIKWKYIDDNPMKWASDEYYTEYGSET